VAATRTLSNCDVPNAVVRRMRHRPTINRDARGPALDHQSTVLQMPFWKRLPRGVWYHQYCRSLRHSTWKWPTAHHHSTACPDATPRSSVDPTGSQYYERQLQRTHQYRSRHIVTCQNSTESMDRPTISWRQCESSNEPDHGGSNSDVLTSQTALP
jgi:hypothetical protein